MTDIERERIVLEVLHFQKPSALESRAINAWGLSSEAVAELSEPHHEAAYSRYSVPALEKLVNKISDRLWYSSGNSPRATARLAVQSTQTYVQYVETLVKHSTAKRLRS